MLALFISGLFLGPVDPGTITLSPRDLFDGFEARKVVLNSASLGLDPHVWQSSGEQLGIVVTDPIDLGPREGDVALAAHISSVRVKLSALTPAGSSVDVAIRSGSNRFSEVGWSPWKNVHGHEGVVESLAGRYVQVRLTLCGVNKAACPTVTGLSLTPRVAILQEWKGKVQVVKWDRPAFRLSPLPFHYERTDNPKLQRFRSTAKLDTVIAGPGNDFDKLVRLMDWIGSGQNVRGFPWESGSGEPYPWDIDRLLEVTAAGKLVVKGHCMSYAVALVSAATALGYRARHWAIEGFREMDHEVAEIWVPNLRKWVYFDPSLTSYYFDEKSREPLSLLELHNLVAKRFLRAGEDMKWWSEQNNNSTRTRVREVGGRTGVGCRLGPWNYGKPMPRDYDWGWNHGYLACGFIQLTPRNDFHSHPEAASKVFGAAPRLTADGYPAWVDDKTPPYADEHGRATNWYTRARDFYWTPDSSALELTKAGEGVLRVEPGNSMPYFSHYQVAIDNGPAQKVTSSLNWNLHAGRNRLEVIPVDEFGKPGAGNSVLLDFSGGTK